VKIAPASAEAPPAKTAIVEVQLDASLPVSFATSVVLASLALASCELASPAESATLVSLAESPPSCAATSALESLALASSPNTGPCVDESLPCAAHAANARTSPQLRTE